MTYAERLLNRSGDLRRAMTYVERLTLDLHGVEDAEKSHEHKADGKHGLHLDEIQIPAIILQLFFLTIYN